MSDELHPLWMQTEDHRKQLSELQVRQAVHQEMLGTHTAQIAQITKDSGERHGQIVALISHQTTKLDAMIGEHNQEKGAALYRRWLIPLVLSGLAIAVTMGIVR